MDVKIRRPILNDRDQLNEFFKTVITDTFIKEGIGDQVNDLNEEIDVKKRYLESDLGSEGETRYFLIALLGEKIIGSIEYGPANDIITNSTEPAIKDLIEVGTVFVHPEFQKKGVGNLLLKALYDTLKQKGIEEFWLDSGYKSAQSIWKKKFGKPAILLENYWGENFDHMIWRVRVSEIE